MALLLLLILWLCFHDIHKCSSASYNAGPTPWSEWSPCSASCGTSGTRTRIRFCYNPMASYGGHDCPDTMPMHETGSCPSTNCPSATTDAGQIESVSAWSTCQLARDGITGFQVRNKDCKTRHCSEDRQEELVCTHPSTATGVYKNLYKATFTYILHLLSHITVHNSAVLLSNG